MKNPKSNYIGEARRIKRNRMFIRVIISAAVILIVSFAIFFKYILSLKKDIDDEFPSSASGEVTGSTVSESTVPPSSDTSVPEDTTATTPPVTETTPRPHLPGKPEIPLRRKKVLQRRTIRKTPLIRKSRLRPRSIFSRTTGATGHMCFFRRNTRFRQ